MRLEKIKIKNYKSLKDVTLSLGNFNVLIGPNNSGKTNILDCLSILSELTTTSINEIVENRGGYDHVVFGGDTEENIEIKTCLISDKGKINYDMTFGNRIITESLYNEYRKFAEHIKADVTRFNENKQEEIRTPNWSDNHSFFYLIDKAREKEEFPTLIEALNYFQSWRFYKLNPSAMRRQNDVRHEYDIGQDGSKSNLVLHTLLSQHLPIFIDVQRVLKSCIREIDLLMSPTTKGGYTYIALKEKAFDKPFDYHQLSDGTLSLIAHLLIIFSPKRKALIGIEEPEDYIHPNLLKAIVDIMKAADIQIIAITHSPFFIDHVEPEELILVEKKEGQTICNKGPSKNEINEFLKKFSLGELWVSGELTDEM